MKIAILNDLHFGVRNGSSVFENELSNFLINIFFPYIREQNIKEIIVAGDLFDDRKSINVKTLNIIKNNFFDVGKNDNLTFHIIPGNHDIYYKNTLIPNSISPIVSLYDNVHLYNNPTIVEFDSYKIGFVPWICIENEQKIQEFIQNKNCSTLITHTEVKGSQNVPGIFTDHGFEPEYFYEYDFVLNGHIHTKSQISSNIINLGTQYQMNWSDYSQRKGFHILDTETKELSFIENMSDLYLKIFFDDSLIDGVDPLLWLKDHHSLVDKKFIKIIVTGSIDRFILDKFMQSIMNDFNTYDVKIIEDMTNIFNENFSEDFIQQNKSTIHIIHEMIDDLTVDKSYNKDIIKSLMTKFYTVAINKDVYAE